MAKKKIGKITKPVSLDGMDSMQEHLRYLSARLRARDELHHGVLKFLQVEANEDAQKMDRVFGQIRDEFGFDGDFALETINGIYHAVPLPKKD